MSKHDKAKELLQRHIDGFRDSANQYDHAINVRKKTIEGHVELIKSLKEIIKDLARKKKSTARVQDLYRKYVEDYNMHVSVLKNLKVMLANARDEEYLLGLLLKDK